MYRFLILTFFISIYSFSSLKYISSQCIPLYTCSKEDDKFLDDLEHRIFNYFWKEIFPSTGIAIDHTENRIGKTAATGFELAAVCIGVERRWITREEGYGRVLQILNTFWDDPDDSSDVFVDGHFGLFWHFVDGNTGKMLPIDCVAMCDSADFIAGLMLAGEYFKGTDIEKLSKQIYDNVQWDKFVTKKPNGNPGLMSFGWVPPHVSTSYPDIDGLLHFNMGFLSDNSLLIYAIALGSDTHPIPIETWKEYVSNCRIGEYAGYECAQTGALFCRQVPQSFIRFSRKRDYNMDYFLDAVNAILADRAFNIKENGYPKELWGLTDCFGKDTYSHAAPPGAISNDGTVGTTAFVGALPHVPNLSLEAMKYVLDKFDDRVWGEYGFTSSVSLKNNFCSDLYVGIELGPMIMMIENFRSGLIWNLFMRSQVMKNFVKRANISGVIDDFELPQDAPQYASWQIEGGEVKVTKDRPQNGFKCLSINSKGETVKITGHLTENDLMQFNFAKNLSLWVRDIKPNDCSISIGDKKISLFRAGVMPGRNWYNYYFTIPKELPKGDLCEVSIQANITGKNPAIDNISLEEDEFLKTPNVVRNLNAKAANMSSSITINWIVPEYPLNNKIIKYLAAISKIPIYNIDDAWKSFKLVEIPAWELPGAKQEQSILLEQGKKYYVAMSSIDEHGRYSPITDTIEVTANEKSINYIAYNFENNEINGWTSCDPSWRLQIINGGIFPGFKCLQVEYNKMNPWQYLMIDVDPEMISVNRYISINIKGKVELLGKLWCCNEVQEDMNRQYNLSSDKWATLKFDTWAANLLPSYRNKVIKLLLFIEPGKVETSGKILLDNIRYLDK